MRTRSYVRIQRRRRWDAITWWYSLILVLPLALILAQWAFGFGPGGGDSHQFTLTVLDGTIREGHSWCHGGLGVDPSTTTDAHGRLKAPYPDRNSAISVQMTGYEPVYGAIDSSFDSRQSVSLAPIAETTQPTGEAAQSQSQPTQPPSDTSAAQPTAQPTSQANAAATTAGDDPVVDTVAGKILSSEDGKAIDDAEVRAGKKVVQVSQNGGFELDGVAVGDELVVSAPGYKDKTVTGAANMSVSLDREDIKAVYLSGTAAADSDIVNNLIGLIDRTELNAVVIDINEGNVYYDTKVKFFQDAGAVDPTFDPAVLVKRFHEHGIYTIARQVVYNDPLVAEAYPNLAVQDVNGGLWKGTQGTPWVNPFKKELWQPNIDLALEAASYGFNEIQYDYIRFPSDGDLSTADFGPNYTEDGRVKAIVDFLKLSHEQLAPTGTKLAVDVFGIVAVYGDDQGIGQRLADIAPVVDYVCPMVYPSHFDPTSIDVGGEPNDFPYDTVHLAVKLGLKKMPGYETKMRPWLQDFTLGGMSAYGADQVDAQIKASEELDTSGWMLWNPNSEFTEDALKSDTGPNT